jgi:hypothetical protein
MTEATIVRAVAVGTPGSPTPNTLVLGGASIVVPIEMNPEEDPLHDDEVRLWSVRGTYDRTLLASDAEVEPDHDSRLMHYRFDDVPFGVYRIAVCVAGEWHDLMHGLVVAEDGAYLGGKKLETDKPQLEVAPPDQLADGDADDDSDADGDPVPLVTFSHGGPREDDDG